MPESSRMMVPWTVDAAGVDVANLRIPHCREDLRVFLESRVGSLHRILVAPKGYGKTLYLKYKARRIRELYSDKGIPIFPSSVKSQDIEFLKLSLDWREMWQDVARLTINDWSLLWQFVLTAKGVQMLDAVAGLDDYLGNLLQRKTEPVADLLSAVIRDRAQFGLNKTQRLRQLRQAFNDADRDAVIFIDNTDEMFVGLERVLQLREVELKPLKAQTSTAVADAFRQEDAELSAEVAKTNPAMWKAAQVGLLLAVREIERSVQLLSVYTTLRAEAINTAAHEDALQAKSYIVPITYEEDDLEAIFGWHVELMPKEELAAPDLQHPAERLMGAGPLAHSYVRTIDGVLREETPFDLILRHTTLSPRELIVIGGHIARLSKADRTGPDRSDRIRRAIGKATGELLDYFRFNAIPRWMEDWERELAKFSAPVMRGDVALEVLGPASAKFYSYGLLGVARPNGTLGQYSQTFLTQWDGDYAAQELPLPRADYYFLHPWLHDWAKRFNDEFSLEQSNIVGSKCTYRPPGLVRVKIGRDANNRPTLWADNVPEGFPTRNGKVFLIASTFASLLIAAKRHATSRITPAQLAEGREEFERMFPELADAESSEPFKSAGHASHLRGDVIKAFPNLGARILALRGDLRVLGVGTKSLDPRIEFDFIDIDKLEV